MKPRDIFLIAGIAVCAASITLVMVKGNPQDRVSFDSISEIGEGALRSVHKLGTMLRPVSEAEETKIGDKIHGKFLRGRLAGPGRPNTALTRFLYHLTWFICRVSLIDR